MFFVTFEAAQKNIRMVCVNVKAVHEKVRDLPEAREKNELFS
jgi:hypothetical protein